MKNIEDIRFFIYDWVIHDPFDKKDNDDLDDLDLDDLDDLDPSIKKRLKQKQKQKKRMTLNAYAIPQFPESWYTPSNKSKLEKTIVRFETQDFMPWIYATLPLSCNKDYLRVHGDQIFRSFYQLMKMHTPENCYRRYQKRKIDEEEDNNNTTECFQCFRGKMQFVQRGRLYYGHSSSSSLSEKPWFIKISCVSENQRRRLRYALEKKTIVLPEPAQTHVIHILEGEASPLLQMTTQQKLPSVGWVRIVRKPQRFVPRDPYSDIQFGNLNLPISYDCLVWCEEMATVPKPTILSFDLEVYSSDPSRMPSSDKPEDVIFQVGVSVRRRGADHDKKFVLTISPTNDNEKMEQTFKDQRVSEHETMILCEDEGDLLLKFRKLWMETNPVVVTGYNIFGFDFPYLEARCKMLGLDEEFFELGPFHEKAPIKIVNWSSSAYRDQHFTFPLTKGVLIVDLLPIVRRDFKLANYKLKTVSSTFLGDTKDPLTPQDLFRAYECLCCKKTPDGIDKMLEVARYCIQDADLVLRLFGFLQTWVGLCEMARICQVSFWSLYTQGQQIKVFSQIYRHCQEIKYVIDPPSTPEVLPYTGAHVFPPQPGIYSWVVPFDFASLYPTTIIAYNIDYSTFIPEPMWGSHTDPNTYHHIEWEEHTCCEHDLEEYTPTTRPTYVFCGSRAFRFLKEPKGVLPTLLETLLGQRKETRKQMKTLGDSEEDKSIYEVLDKRQLAYKVSANSMYGAMGVSRGYLPFMPGAMCTTAMGRYNIMKAANYVQETYGAKLVYGDTDSIYVHFPGITEAKDLWDHAVNVEAGLLSLFPKPMKLAFEEKLYNKFLILTKKRYMALTCDATGILDKKLTIRGVLLARRDNCSWVRKVYEQIVRGLMASKTEIEIAEALSENILDIFQKKVPISQFIVTKLVGSEYVVQPLVQDTKKKEKRLKDLGIDPVWYLKEEKRLVEEPGCCCVDCRSGKGGKGSGNPGTMMQVLDVDRWVDVVERFFQEYFPETEYTPKKTFQSLSRLSSSDYLSLIREGTFSEWLDKTRFLFFILNGEKKVQPNIGTEGVLDKLMTRYRTTQTTSVTEEKKTLGDRGWNGVMIEVFKECVRMFLRQEASHEIKISLPLTIEQVKKYVQKETWNLQQKRRNHCAGKCGCGPCRFHKRSLPAHVQLAMRMEERGDLVGAAGTRLEYVIINKGYAKEDLRDKEKLFDKLEDPLYTNRFYGAVSLDWFYYLHLLEFPMDQLMMVCFKKPLFKKLVECHRNKYKVLHELLSLFHPSYTVLDANIPYSTILRF